MGLIEFPFVHIHGVVCPVEYIRIIPVYLRIIGCISDGNLFGLKLFYLKYLL